MGRRSRTPSPFRLEASDETWSPEPSWENTYTAWGDVAEVAAGDEGKVDAPGVRASAILRAHDASESVYSADAKLGVVDSHALVEVSAADGRPMVRVGHSERFVYVDEHACIGCTLCAGAAPATFFMEEWFGRARVYQQQGDAAPVIESAIELCPVSCIHYVPLAKLETLEVRRRTQKINPRSRRGDMAGEAPRDDIPLWTETNLWALDDAKVAKAKANPQDPHRWDDIEVTPAVRAWGDDGRYADADARDGSSARVLGGDSAAQQQKTPATGLPPPVPPVPQAPPGSSKAAAPTYRRRVDL